MLNMQHNFVNYVTDNKITKQQPLNYTLKLNTPDFVFTIYIFLKLFTISIV